MVDEERAKGAWDGVYRARGDATLVEGVAKLVELDAKPGERDGCLSEGGSLDVGGDARGDGQDAIGGGGCTGVGDVDVSVGEGIAWRGEGGGSLRGEMVGGCGPVRVEDEVRGTDLSLRDSVLCPNALARGFIDRSWDISAGAREHARLGVASLEDVRELLELAQADESRHTRIKAALAEIAAAEHP